MHRQEVLGNAKSMAVVLIHPEAAVHRCSPK